MAKSPSPPTPPPAASIVITRRILDTGHPASCDGPTHVVEVLPGNALPWLAANGGFEAYLAHYHGPGSYVCSVVSPDCSILRAEEIYVPPVQPAQPAPPAHKEEPAEERSARGASMSSDRQWAERWAASFLKETLGNNPPLDALDLYLTVAGVLEKHRASLRILSFRSLCGLTDSIVQSYHAGQLGSRTRTGVVARSMSSGGEPRKKLAE